MKVYVNREIAEDGKSITTYIDFAHETSDVLNNVLEKEGLTTKHFTAGGLLAERPTAWEHVITADYAIHEKGVLYGRFTIIDNL